ncbi:hypothetical protein MOQ_006863 [Trypanosoma cruzi marinkellei]|uniref:Uncharacterized protein n=1 Tax=Trypanosoma cruzi marinkellei TaxID=85056 RepID=K2M2Z3_TRYCR|nr:hypothetical protein MOQ_006863 [Trypanosoma cruzi marinkellei]
MTLSTPHPQHMPSTPPRQKQTGKRRRHKNASREQMKTPLQHRIPHNVVKRPEACRLGSTRRPPFFRHFWLKGGHPPAAVRRSHEECRQQACRSHPPSPSQKRRIVVGRSDVVSVPCVSTSLGEETRRPLPPVPDPASSLFLHKPIISRRVAHGSVSTILNVRRHKLLLPETQSDQSKSEPDIQRLQWPNPTKLHHPIMKGPRRRHRRKIRSTAEISLCCTQLRCPWSSCIAKK